MVRILKKLFLNELEDVHTSEVIKNTVITFTLKILALVLSYIFNFIISRFYGASVLGLLNIAITTISLCGIFSTLGFDQAILRFSAQFSHNKSFIFQIYKKMATIALLSSVIISSLLMIFSAKLSMVLTKTFEHNMLFIIISTSIPFFTIGAINTEAVRGLKLIKESEFFRMLLGSIINLAIFALLVLIMPFHIYLPIFSSISGIFITAMISFIYLLKKISPKHLDKRELKLTTTEIFTVSLPMLAISLANVISHYIPIFLLAYFKTTKDVGIFNIALKIATVTSFILISINSIVAPKFAELYWSNQLEDLKKTVKIASKLNYWTSTPFLILFFLFPDFFMGIFGEEFKDGSTALVILSIGQFVNAFSGSVGYFLTMTGKQQIFSNILVLSMILNGLLSVILTPLFGINGCAIGFTAGMVFWNIVSLIYIKKRYGIETYYLPFVD